MTDRERARLIALLRDAARALRPASTYDAWLPERLKREADELARGAYRREHDATGYDCWCNPTFRDDIGATLTRDQAEMSWDAVRVVHSEVPETAQNVIKSPRDDRRDHDRHSPRTL